VCIWRLAGWPVVDMKKDRDTGVWSYTTPLPSGEFNYDFVVDCSRSDEQGSLSPPSCLTLSDPSNPPWNERGGVIAGSREPTSQGPIHYNALSDLFELRRAGQKVFKDFINGGHDWYVWRILLRDFLTRVAFRPVGG
jgi:hypothetical protein